MQRKIDEIPSRAELTQYQRRFIELYSQGTTYMYLEYKRYGHLKNSHFLKNTQGYITHGFSEKWLRNHSKFLLHFLIHIDVLMLCSKFELIPTSIFRVMAILKNGPKSEKIPVL